MSSEYRIDLAAALVPRGERCRGERLLQLLLMLLMLLLVSRGTCHLPLRAAQHMIHLGRREEVSHEEHLICAVKRLHLRRPSRLLPRRHGLTPCGQEGQVVDRLRRR